MPTEHHYTRQTPNGKPASGSTRNSAMKIESTPLQGLMSFTPKRHQDARGFFMETWRDEWLHLLGTKHPFVQENHARSEEVGVLRGLHFQAPPFAQGKLIWVTHGSILDVAVDIRKSSKTYGQWYSVLLSAENATRLFLPRGFAHGCDHRRAYAHAGD